MSTASVEKNRLLEMPKNDLEAATLQWDFGISLPLWCLTTVQDSGLAIFKISLQDGTTATPLFTEEELAQQYVESLPTSKQRTQLTVLNVDELLMLFLGFCKCHGVTNIAFDPSDSRGEIRPVDEVESYFIG